MTVKTLANIFVPIINPTLKKANFAPKILVKPNDKRANKDYRPEVPDRSSSSESSEEEEESLSTDDGPESKGPKL